MTYLWQRFETSVPIFGATRDKNCWRSSDPVNVIRLVFFAVSLRGVLEKSSFIWSMILDLFSKVWLKIGPGAIIGGWSGLTYQGPGPRPV